MSKHQRSWKNLLIMPDVQWRMIGAAIILSILQTALVQVFIARFAEELARKMEAAGLAAGHPLTIFLERQTAHLERMGLGLGLVLAIANFAVFLIVSHRIAGPLWKIQRTIAQWREGENTELRLRKGDAFQSLAGDIRDLRKNRY